jgi:DNA (cytosine-5)-methyltransferase 1
MRVLDLFSGIGGFSLGLERAGLRTVAFCEIDPYCRKVLAKHWPDVPTFPDVRQLCRRTWENEPENEDGFVECKIHQGEDFGNCACIGTDQFIDEIGPIDVICGGFPCQDISLIGEGGGINGEHSGLWKEYARIIGELQPEYVLVENVAALLGRGIGRVLGDLAALGYNAEWHCIPASAVGAPHRRDRVWIVANSNDARLERHAWNGEVEGGEIAHRSIASTGLLSGADLAGWWKSEPGIRRVVDGVPSFVDRITCLGNAVIPQIPEMIGRAIMAQNQSLTLRTR